MENIFISIREHDSLLAASVIRGDSVFPVSQPLPEFDQTDAAALRWLLEDSPRLASQAAEVEAIGAMVRLRDFGDRLFQSLQEPLTLALGDLSLDRVALSIDDPNGLTRHWPWELLSQDGAEIVLDCHSFARKVGQKPSRLSPGQHTEPLRLLIVVSRPLGSDDVSFRSVASRILQSSSENSIHVELLRPPTFRALKERLLSARNAGSPFDLVHFDGHGTLLDTPAGQKGVLLFENDSSTGDDLVDGSQIGKLLAEADVALLILNACHSGAAALPAPTASAATPVAGLASASLAEQVAGFGAIDVVAMSHAVYVSTAALIVEDLYRCLELGHSIGAAVNFARRRWRDGFVERSPSIGHSIIRHFGCPAEVDDDSVDSTDWPNYEDRLQSDDRTPAHPKMQPVFRSDEPFVAADTRILLLERALRRTGIVQLNGLAGSGKTSLLLELGRWLAASNADQPERIVYIDLGAAPSPAQGIESIVQANAGFLFIDHADCVEGGILRKIDPWPSHQTEAFVNCLNEKSKHGVEIIVAASGRMSALGLTERVVVPRLEIEDIRKLVELRTDRESAAQLPEPAILWSAGLPTMVPILVERLTNGHFADATKTLEALWELGRGQFITTQPPVEQIVKIPGGEALFEPDVGLPWLLMQFQGQALLSPILWQLAAQTGLTSLANAESEGSLARTLENLETAGLVTPLDSEGFLLNPLLPCIFAQPCNTPQLATDSFFRSLMLLQGMYAHYIQVLAGSPLSSEVRSQNGNTIGWDLPNLLHAFDCLAGNLQVEHMGALSLARRLRTRFVDMQLDDYWEYLFQKLKEVFEAYPPPPDDGQFNPQTEMNLLLMEEATRQGDNALALELAQKAREAAHEMPGAEQGHTQANLYDVQLKSGRLLASTDVKAAVSSFKIALEAAGEDPFRKATVQLELTRSLRSIGKQSDLVEARIHGESALALFEKLVRAKICEREQLALITMSLSLVYQDLFQKTKTRKPDPAWAMRGEQLCRDSLQLAEEPRHQATAWFNLGNWRQLAKDFEDGANAFLEAATLYEKLEDKLLLGYSLIYQANCLLKCEEYLQARVTSVRALTVLMDQPNRSDQMFLLGYQIGEEAWSKLTTKSVEDE